MSTLDNMTKLGCWQLKCTHQTTLVIWILPWPYDQIKLLTTDLTLLHICWHGHDGFPWPYDHIGLLTIDQTVIYMFDWPGHIGPLTTDQTVILTGLVMMSTFDHMTKLDNWPSYNVHVWLAWYCMMNTQDLMTKLGSWPLTKLHIRLAWSWWIHMTILDC